MIIAIFFWLWFEIGSAYVERAGPFNWLMHTSVPGGTFILSLSTLVAWRWEGIGGALLALEGIVALGFILALLESFLQQENLVAQMPAKLAIVEAGRVRIRTGRRNTSHTTRRA